MTRAALFALAALLLIPPVVADAVCTPEQLHGPSAVRCVQAHLTAINRCLKKGTPLGTCAAQVHSSACERLPSTCQPAAQVYAVIGAVYGSARRDACRARLARASLKLLKRGLARARGGTLAALPSDLATCTDTAASRCGSTPLLSAPCNGAVTTTDAAACVCNLALPVLPASVEFLPAACPSHFAPPACASATSVGSSCHEAFAVGAAQDFCFVPAPDRASYSPPADSGAARAWSFPIRPRGRTFLGPYPEATGAVSARSDGLGPAGSSIGASSDGHLRLKATLPTTRLLLLRWFTGGIPDGAEARLLVTAGARVLADVTTGAGGPEQQETTAVLSWQGDLDVTVSTAISAGRDRPVASADLAWRLAVLDPTADDDVDGTTNARDPSPLDRTVPAVPPPSARPRVLVLGLDGVGWDALDPLIDAGYLPTIGGLIRGGARAALDETGNGPTCCFCPPVWSSIATGEPRTRHAMLALEAEPLDRPVPAIWTVLAAHGGTTTQVSYRNTFPAEPGVTYNVSEPGVGAAGDQIFDPQQRYVTDDTFDRLNLTWPPLLFETLGVLPPTAPPVPAWFPFVVDRTGADALARLAATAPTDLTMWILHSIDKSEHLMWGTIQYDVGGPIDEAVLRQQAAWWRGPITGGCCNTYAGFAWGDVASQYLEAEQHVARVLAAARYDYVVFVSDHAMSIDPGGTLPGNHFTPPSFNGIFAVAGPGIVPGLDLGTVSLLDVTPTLAYLLDLPVADDLPGDVVAAAFTADHLAAAPIRRVPSWTAP